MRARDRRGAGGGFPGQLWLWLAFSLAGCGAATSPCRSPSHCAASEECLANRCVALGAEPVAPSSRRLVVDATSVAVVRPGATGSLPASVHLGGPGLADEALVVRLPVPWQALDIEAAFLLLTPAPSAEPTSADVPLEVELAGSDWSSRALADRPRATGPSSRGLARTRPPSVLRIDVTQQLRALGNARQANLLLHASARSERAAVYLTGAAGGSPRLELYARQAR